MFNIPQARIYEPFGPQTDQAALGWISHMPAFETTDAQLTNVRYRGIIRTSILEGVTAAFV